MEFAVLCQILSGYKLLHFYCCYYISIFVWHSTDLTLHEICLSLPLFPQSILWNWQNIWRERKREPLGNRAHEEYGNTPFRVWNWLYSTKIVLEGAHTSMLHTMLENYLFLLCYRIFEALHKLSVFSLEYSWSARRRQCLFSTVSIHFM